jgi:GNAT superfamily N-acetyltransferase
VATTRADLGPTLPQLVGARRARRLLLAALAAAAALVAWNALRPEPGIGRVLVERPVAFNLDAGELGRADAPAGAVLRLARPQGESLTARPVALPAYRGDVVAALMATAPERARALRAELGDDLVVRGEGRTRVNEQPGYQLQYQFRQDGATAYGRLVLLVPKEQDDPMPRRGVALDLRTPRNGAVPNVFAVGNNGVLKTPLRSFRFGTDLP